MTEEEDNKKDDSAMEGKSAAKEEKVSEVQRTNSKSDDGKDEIEQDSDDDKSDEDDEDEQAANVEPLATTRSRRANAGNLMSKIIQDEDEFYTNLYGGFNDEEDDDDFDDENDVNSDEVEDEVDSDFSMSETDEIAPEFQEVDDEPRRKAGVYKDPKPRGQTNAQSGPSSGITSTPKVKPTSSHKTPISPSKNRAERSFRDSTRKKTEETIKNIASGKKKKKFKTVEAPRRLTQEELLEEAKITEAENIKSLEVYQRSETERLKKIKQTKRTLPAPYVSYLSTTMPIIDSEERYTRNFVTYIT